MGRGGSRRGGAIRCLAIIAENLLFFCANLAVSSRSPSTQYQVSGSSLVGSSQEAAGRAEIERVENEEGQRESSPLPLPPCPPVPPPAARLCFCNGGAAFREGVTVALVAPPPLTLKPPPRWMLQWGGVHQLARTSHTRDDAAVVAPRVGGTKRFLLVSNIV